MGKPTSENQPLIDFFLHLYAVQTLGSGKKPEAVEAALVTGDTAQEAVYELKLKTAAGWKSRRMSIRSLGEQVESKSMCYKVTYDDLLVVKIPPKPITDFNAYLESIHKEHRIADRLSPDVSCVYPRLGAILKKVPAMKLPSDFSLEEAEKAYIQQLTREPGLQRYLKIGGSFVFFMNLSKYQFFNQVIESMHIVEDRVREEIVKNIPEALMDLHTFESLYGEENDSVFFALNGLLTEYGTYIDQLAGKYAAQGAIADYERREWFFSGLAGVKPEIDPGAISEPFRQKLNSLMNKLLQAKQQTVSQLYKTVRTRVQQRNFSNNRMRIKGLIVNVIGLLHRLQERSLAIRDLKPDNLYIDRRLDGADHILANQEAYGLGLIDLETAVCFDPPDKMEQPLLAGTPAYATPAHVFPNRVLRKVYPDQFSRIFYMQDWFAGIGMIFNIVTGRLLFVKAARLMPEIIRAKRGAPRTVAGITGLYKNISGKFWETAINEFNEKILIFRRRFEAVELTLPRELSTFLQQEIATEQALIDITVARWAEACQSLAPYRDQLTAASHAAVVKNIQKRQNSATSAAAKTSQTLHVLSKIARYKFRREHLDRLAMDVSGPIDSRFLISFVFDRTFYAMHRQDWTHREPWLIGPCIQMAQSRGATI